MRTNKSGGFTLIELLIVIAIIGILAAVLIPNLLNARSRAFDTAAQSCLKELASNEEIVASIDPWEYTGNDLTKPNSVGDTFTWTLSDGATTGTVDLSSCEGVVVAAATHSDTVVAAKAATSWFAYTGSHINGGNTYRIEVGSGVSLETAGSVLASTTPTPTP